MLQNYEEKSNAKKMNVHKRYVNAIDFDRGSNEQHTHEIETLEGAISTEEIIPYAEYGNSYGGEEHNEGNLLNIGATTFVVHVQGIASNLTYGGEEHDEGNLLLNLNATTFVVHVQKIALNLYVWDPGISSEFQILTSSNKIIKARALFEEIKKRKSFLLVKFYYKDEFTCYMYKECNNLMMLCFWVAIPNSTIIKWHQHSNSLALSIINKEGWKRKVETNLLKLEHGLQYLNLIEGSKFEDENAYYVVIANRLGQSSLVQIILGANSHISILLLLVEDDASHCYIIMTENSCEEYFSL
ncbi:hypothetical protein H5410_064878 [Solanum commersonii]|uniref:Uncharacterized protein n=1 Tax=Solanum commersonii TaxID=4109 RepID=A0A9J5VY55_SOLCO|nr:hypothetical protein H5410_064878 [Solanum commersonii]